MKTLLFQETNGLKHIMDVEVIKDTPDSKICKVQSEHNKYKSVNIKNNIVKVLKSTGDEIKSSEFELCDYSSEKLFIYGGNVYATGAEIKVVKSVNNEPEYHTLRCKGTYSKCKLIVNDIELLLEQDGMAWSNIKVIANSNPDNVSILEKFAYDTSKSNNAYCISFESDMHRLQLQAIKDYDYIVSS